jgi:hypothetical protein
METQTRKYDWNDRTRFVSYIEKRNKERLSALENENQNFGMLMIKSDTENRLEVLESLRKDIVQDAFGITTGDLEKLICKKAKKFLDERRAHEGNAYYNPSNEKEFIYFEESMANLVGRADVKSKKQWSGSIPYYSPARLTLDGDGNNFHFDGRVGYCNFKIRLEKRNFTETQYKQALKFIDFLKDEENGKNYEAGWRIGTGQS